MRHSRWVVIHDCGASEAHSDGFRRDSQLTKPDSNVGDCDCGVSVPVLLLLLLLNKLSTANMLINDMQMKKYSKMVS